MSDGPESSEPRPDKDKSEVSPPINDAECSVTGPDKALYTAPGPEDETTDQSTGTSAPTQSLPFPAPLSDSTSDPADSETPDSDDSQEPDSAHTGPNPFFGAAQFFSWRGFFAAISLFFLTTIVAVLAMDLIWSLLVAALFTVAISTGHLVFYTKDRAVRERVYFVLISVGTFSIGSLVVDLQLTLPYFIELREFNAATSELVHALEEDARFQSVKVSTRREKKVMTADLAGSVSSMAHRDALRGVVQDKTFVVGRFDVTVATPPATSDMESESTTPSDSES